LPPDELKRAFPAIEEENMIFRTFLKGLEPDELDGLVHEMHRELFDKTDCRACSNCCKVIVPALDSDDVERISRLLSISEQDFRKKYLVYNDDGWVFNSKPCPFLTERGCSIYDYRPEICREYPFTDKDELICRLFNLMVNCEVCPVVFEIVERLKAHYHKKFQRYKRAMRQYW
jgi:Fe-S-cluster containining protein